MIKWGDIPAAAKMSAAAVVGVMGILGYLTTYQTDAEAMQYQKQHGQQLVLVRIQNIENQISQYRYQLLSTKLSAEQRQWINDEIDKLNEVIKCIRNGTC